MKKKRRAASLIAGLALAIGALSGCQTWTSGMTLPSGHYLEHPPQYFPPSPPFPLPRELSNQERAAAAAMGGEGGATAPPAFVPGGRPGPGAGGGVIPEP